MMVSYRPRATESGQLCSTAGHRQGEVPGGRREQTDEWNPDRRWHGIQPLHLAQSAGRGGLPGAGGHRRPAGGGCRHRVPPRSGADGHQHAG